MSNYGKAFALMRDAAAEPWRDYTRHAFVEGMKDGTLPREAFLHYLRQDYVFLIHFSRAWALAVVKSETHEEMLAASRTVNGLISEEMKLHIGICEAEGISQAELFATPERHENLAYTRFVPKQATAEIFWTCWRPLFLASWGMVRSVRAYPPRQRPRHIAAGSTLMPARITKAHVWRLASCWIRL